MKSAKSAEDILFSPNLEKFFTKGMPLPKAAMAKEQYPCIAQIWSFLIDSIFKTLSESFGYFQTVSWYLRVRAS